MFLWIDGLSWMVLLLVSLGISHAFAVRWWPELGSWRLRWAGTSRRAYSLTHLVPFMWLLTWCLILWFLSAWPFSAAEQLVF